MTETTPRNMADKLLTPGFERDSPAASALTDPIADTPMVVTLDELRPYDHDPRIKRNPAWDDIKASIRERGLDAAPAITRRPGENHFIIRNGGNTRLAILRELWAETKDERFYRIPCLFRPWSERGEIMTLTGHLAENELRGNLTFIERALGVERARELYQQASEKPLNQSELAQRLRADGYPVPQPHISRMSDTVRYLLPAIPTVLYAGLGRHQIERLVSMRNTGKQIWEKHAKDRDLTLGFDEFFQDVMSQFDSQEEEFSFPRIQDELIGQMRGILGISYEQLHFELNEDESRRNVRATLLSLPTTPPRKVTAAKTPMPHQPEMGVPLQQNQAATAPQIVHQAAPTQTANVQRPEQTGQPNPAVSPAHVAAPENTNTERLQNHIISPAQTTERLQSIQTLIAEQLGESAPPDFASNILQSIPVQVGGLYPISDIWHIDPGLDSPDRLRIHIAQFAQEIAAKAAIPEVIEPCTDGIGFRCESIENAASSTPHAHAIVALLQGVAGISKTDGAIPLDALLWGNQDEDSSTPRLTDEALVKLSRLIRLARRLAEYEVDTEIADA